MAKFFCEYMAKSYFKVILGVFAFSSSTGFQDALSGLDLASFSPNSWVASGFITF